MLRGRISKFLALGVALSLALLSCAPRETDADSDDSTTGQLHALFDREWEFRLREDPLQATAVGRHEYDHLLPSVGADDQHRRAEVWRGYLVELEAIDRSDLEPTDQISFDIFRNQIEDAIADVDFGAWQIPLNADSGFQTEFARLPEEMPLATEADHDNYAARLRAFPAYVEQQIANMRAGMRRGMTQPAVVLVGLDDGIAAHVVEDLEDSVFYQPYLELPSALPANTQARLREVGRAAVEDGAIAGYRAFLDFMTTEYIPSSRQSLGASELPDGVAFYRQQIRHFTTLDLTPEEIHATGVSEVDRIQAEMAQIIDDVGFDGDFDAFLQFLRTDPRFYAKTPEELLQRAAWLAKKMDGRLPSLFGTLPRLPYTVEPVPAQVAPKYTAGRYVGAPQGSGRPGAYWVNTHALQNRPLYTLEALTLHEAVPGHHLQVALNNEMEDLPSFRRYSYISAFGEGWGLYSERLGLEAGFYTDPYSNFGRLTYEMWRACRLVVDTGIHSMGWSRERAIDFLAGHTALSLHEVRTEIDRYISWPAQALSYKLGELKIRALRRRAEEALGADFDIRAFHDAVLLNGAVPLIVLENQVDAWIESAAQKNPAAEASGAVDTKAFFEDTIGVLAVITMIPVFFLWLEKTTRWKIFNVLPAIIWIFLTPIFLSNSGVIPRATPIYSVFRSFAVPMFIVLMLLDINVRQSLKVAWRGIGVLVFGAVGIVAGAFISFFAFRHSLPEGTWQGFGALAGSWIGGTGNLAAVAEAVETPSEMVGIVVLVDNFVYLFYFPIILTCKRWAAGFNRFTRVSQQQMSSITASAGEVVRKTREVHFHNLVMLLGFAFSAILAANWIASLLPEVRPVLTEKTWAMLLVTTLGIILSATPLKKVPGSDALSMTLVYIYMTMMGAQADLRNIRGAQWFLVAGVVCILVHFVFIVIGAKIFRVDVSMAAVASVAAVGGAASAPVAAGFHREDLVPVSIMLALIGYGLGNYLGVATAYLCHLVA